MKHTANLQVLAGKAINANRHQAVRHYGVIVAVCLCATVMVGLTGISV